MTTNEFVSMVLEEVASGWTRTRILEFTNRIQNELLAEDNELMRVKPDPFVATTTAVYTYAATSTLYVSTTGAQGALVGDIRAVREVYSYLTGLALFGTQTIDPASAKPNILDRTFGLNRTVARCAGIDSIEPNSTDCTIRWWEGNNPGTTTVTWRAEAYKWPTQLTAESIALSIPADFQRTLLLGKLKAHIEQREFGEVSEGLKREIKEAKGDFRGRYGKAMSQDMNGVCLSRVC